jgi:uncharacterized membrane protein
MIYLYYFLKIGKKLFERLLQVSFILLVTAFPIYYFISGLYDKEKTYLWAFCTIWSVVLIVSMIVFIYDYLDYKYRDKKISDEEREKIDELMEN